MSQTPVKSPRKMDPRLRLLLDGIKHVFVHNWPTKLLALIVSLSLWAGLITQDPTLTRDKSFSNVEVNVVGEETVKRNGFIVISDLEEALGKVRIVAAVPQMQYANAEAANYNARVDLSRIRTAGTQELRIMTTNTSTYGSVTSVTPATVEVEVDEYITRYRIPVSARTVGEGPEGFYTTISMDPPTVTVSGPRSLVDRITNLEITVDLDTQPAQETVAYKALPFRLVDQQGEEISSKLLEVTSESVLLDAIIVELHSYPTKSLPVSVEGLIVGEVMEGYEIKKIDITPENVIIAGPTEILDAIDNVVPENQISVRGLKSSINRRVRLTSIDGIAHRNVSYLQVAVEIGPVMEEQTYNDVYIQIEGLQEGYAAGLSRVNASVSIKGAQADMLSLKPQQIRLYCDVTGLNPGSYDVPVLCRIDGKEDANLVIEAVPATVTVTITE